MSGEARSTSADNAWPTRPSSLYDPLPRLVVFVSGKRARAETAVHEARGLYRGHHFVFVCEPEHREWLSNDASAIVYVVEQPFNPFGAEADDLRKILESGPIEACALVVADIGFESFRFRVFALRLATLRFVLLPASATTTAKQMNRFSFVLATGATLLLRISTRVAGWIAPLDQPLAVGLAWLARAVTQFKSLPAVSGGKEIVHLLPSMGMGGVQRQLLLLLRNRSPAYSHRVIVMWSDDRFFAPELAACGVPVHYLNFDGMGATMSNSASQQGVVLRLRPILTIFRAAFPFCWEIVKLTFFLRALRPRPDIVHCWLLVANLAGSIAARLAGVPQVVTSVRNVQSEVEFNYYDPRWQRTLERATVPLASVITANAPAVAADYQAFTGTPAAKVVTVPNGVDLTVSRVLTAQERLEKRRAFGLATTDLVVGTVARLAKEKDFKTFFRAFAIARSTLTSLRCLIVGEGPLRAELEAFCSSLNLSLSVQFLGERKDVGDLIQCYDVFLLTSVIEGMPNVVMESQLLGTPVVATRAGGTVDLIQTGETGLLAPIGDAESLASCLVRMLTEDGLRDRICGAASAQIRHNYTVEQLVTRTENIYRELLDGNRGKSKHVCAE